MLTIDIKHRSFEETLLACEALGGVALPQAAIPRAVWAGERRLTA